jgi:hypothetical protein
VVQREVVALALREQLPITWIEALGRLVTVVWHMAGEEGVCADEMESHEFAWTGPGV